MNFTKIFRRKIWSYTIIGGVIGIIIHLLIISTILLLCKDVEGMFFLFIVDFPVFILLSALDRLIDIRDGLSMLIIMGTFFYMFLGLILGYLVYRYSPDKKQD